MENITKTGLVLAALLLLLPCIASAAVDEAVGTVSNVVDGDTIDVQMQSQEIRVRLADVDAPEMSTDNGPAAQQFATQWLYGKLVYLDLDNKTGKDPYDRWVAVVYFRSPSGNLENFNKKLVDAGQACIWDFDDNEFNPADWWNGIIPASACIKEDSSGTAQSYVGPTSAWAGPRQTTASNGPFVGSSKSDKYHYPDCRAAKKIKPGNLITFASSEEARARGYSPCGICNPP